MSSAKPTSKMNSSPRPFIQKPQHDHHGAEDTETSPLIPGVKAPPFVSRTRHRTRMIVTNKWFHYLVLALVSLDVAGIFVEFVIELYTCEGRIGKDGGKLATNIIGTVGNIFSCAFVLELLVCLWAFGIQYLKSKFHIFDAVVVIAGFVIDVCLAGQLEEIAELVIVLRLWRVFKIIEELSVGAEEQAETLNEKIETLERENSELKTQMSRLQAQQQQ